MWILNTAQCVMLELLPWVLDDDHGVTVAVDKHDICIDFTKNNNHVMQLLLIEVCGFQRNIFSYANDFATYFKTQCWYQNVP